MMETSYQNNMALSSGHRRFPFAIELMMEKMWKIQVTFKCLTHIFTQFCDIFHVYDPYHVPVEWSK